MWDSQNIDGPTHTLVCESQPVKCCFGGHRLSQTVFAATHDGSLVAWDLREPESMHRSKNVPNLKAGRAVLRRPTYSTDGLLEEAHTGTICSMEAPSPRARYHLTRAPSSWPGSTGHSPGGRERRRLIPGMLWGRPGPAQPPRPRSLTPSALS